MKPARLDSLSDGIFSIVMTLLVFEMNAPLVADHSSSAALWMAFQPMLPIFISYVLSFALLFTYWRAHHIFVSVYAKNIDTHLTNLNAVFFLFIALVPFSTSLLGAYSNNQLAIMIFGIHTIIIGICLFAIRSYVLNSKEIENIEVDQDQIRRGSVRIFVPIFSAILAIALSFVNKNLSLGLFTFAVLFNFSHTSTAFITKLLGYTKHTAD